MRHPTPLKGETWRSVGGEVVVVDAGDMTLPRRARLLRYRRDDGGTVEVFAKVFLKRFWPAVPRPSRSARLPLRSETWRTAAGAEVVIVDPGDQSIPRRQRRVSFRVTVARSLLVVGDVRSTRVSDFIARWSLVVAQKAVAA